MKKWMLVPLVILLFPVFLAYGVFTHFQRRRRMRQAAKRSVCPECGTILGDDALRLADQLWIEDVSRLRRQNPGVKFRLVRLVDAVCQSCGASLRFSEKTNVFEITKRIPRLDEDIHEH